MAAEDDQIAVRLSLKDAASTAAGLKAVSTEVAHLGGAAGSSSKQTLTWNSALGKLNSGVNTIMRGVKMAGLAVVGFATILGGLAVKQAMEMYKVTAQTNAVIKSTGGIANVTADHIATLSASIMRYSGFTDEAIGATANMLLTFTNIRNQVGAGNDIFDQATRATMDLSQAYSALGKDPVSASLALGKALQDPLTGMTAMRRVGIIFSAQQIAQVKTMMAQNNLLGAQKVILGEINKEFGGSAKAFGMTLPGQIARFKNLTTEALGKVASKVLDLLQGPIEKLISYVDRPPTWIKSLGAWLAGVDWKALLERLTTGFGHFVEMMKQAWPAIKRIGEVAAVAVSGGLAILDLTMKVLGGHGAVTTGLLYGVAAAILAIKSATVILAAANGFQQVVGLLSGKQTAVAAATAAKKKGLLAQIGKAGGIGAAGTAGTAGAAGEVAAGGGLAGAMATVGPILLGIGLVIAAVALIAGAIYLVHRNWSTLTDAFMATGRFFTRVGKTIWQGLSDGFKFVVNLIIDYLNLVIRSLTLGPLGALVAKGLGLKIPQIAKLHSGGTVTSAGAVNVRPDEEIITLPKGASVVPLPAAQQVAGGTGTSSQPLVVQLAVDRKVLAEVMVAGVRAQAARR